MVMDKLVEKDNFMSAFTEASKTFHGKESFETWIVHLPIELSILIISIKWKRNIHIMDGEPCRDGRPHNPPKTPTTNMVICLSSPQSWIEGGHYY